MPFNASTAIPLADMLHGKSFEDSRAAARKALDAKQPDHADVLRALLGSPLIGPGPNQLNVSADWPRFRDALPMPVILGLLTETIGWPEVLAAIAEPVANGFPSVRSKTGYAFGWPKTADLTTQIAQIFDAAKAQGWTPPVEIPALDEEEADDDFAQAVKALDKALDKAFDKALEPTADDRVAITLPTGTVVSVPASAAAPAAAAPTSATPTAKEPMTATPSIASLGVAAVSAVFDEAARIRAIADASNAEGSLGMPLDNAGIEKHVLADFEIKFGADAMKPVRAFVELRASNGKTPDYKTLAADTGLTAEQKAVLDAIASLAAYQTSSAPAAAPEPTPVVQISPGVAMGINAMLKADTGGKLSDINAILKGVIELGSKSGALEREIAELRAIQATAPVAVPVSGELGELTYEVVMRNANDLDWGQKGKRQKLIDFNVPTIVWKDKAGAVVQHPLCPAVDKNYRFSPPTLAALLMSVVKNRIPWLHGHTGSGKTTLVEQLAARLGFPAIRVNFDSEITRTDLIGTTQIKAEGGGTTSYFREGILPQAMHMPCFFLMDEVDFIRSDVSYVLQRALETKGLRLDEDGGRLVTPHPLFRMWATANTRGQGDEFGMYPGAKPQTAAFLDRFFPFIEVDYLKPEVEMKLLLDNVPGIDAATAEQLVKFGNEVRECFRRGEIAQVVSPRGLMGIADSFVFFKSLTPQPKDALEFACKMGAIAKATAQDAARIREFADRCFK